MVAVQDQTRFGILASLVRKRYKKTASKSIGSRFLKLSDLTCRSRKLLYIKERSPVSFGLKRIRPLQNVAFCTALPC